LTPHLHSNRTPHREPRPLLGRRTLLASTLLTSLLATLVAVQTASAQTAFNRNLIVLDPAHGGTDIGAQISDHVLEKDVTLAMALRLRSLLTARGFTVFLTRGNDTALSTDQRAELANRAHAVTCLVLHATASGTGVHLATSMLNAAVPTDASAPVPWDQAQAAFQPQSQRLADEIGAAMNRSHIPLVAGRAALRPLDNLMCPALSVELAPLTSGDADAAPVTDGVYQQRVAAAIAGALIFWRNQAQPPVVMPSRGASPAPQPPNSTTRPGATAGTVQPSGTAQPNGAARARAAGAAIP
jgi:N-acetylmuramoyl-L-alanine amidase